MNEFKGPGAFKRLDDFFKGPRGLAMLCVSLFALTIWTFAPALQCGFQYFDDAAILLKEPHVNTGLDWQNLGWALFNLDYSYSYPLPRISHMLDFTLYGSQPWGHHLTNVLIHAANGVLLFLLLKRMTGALWCSGMVALLFAVHPLRVQSVAWVSERKDVLSVLFGLLALWMYVRRAEEARMPGGRTRLFYGLTLLFFACALMSKSMLVTLPGLLLVLDFWPLERWRRVSKWFLLAEKAPFFLLVALVGFATWFASKAGEGTFILHLPWSMRLETVLMSYGRYWGLMLWPVKLSAIYPYPAHWPIGQLLGATAFCFGMSALAWVWRRQRPYWTAGWLWYVGTLVPVVGLIPLGGESICTRFTYFPMTGALLLAVWGIDDFSRQWRQRAPVIAAVMALATTVCVFRTRAEISYWKDGVTLYNRAIAVTTNNFMAHYCLGEVLFVNHHPNQALAEMQASADLYPDYALSQRSLAVVLEVLGHYPEAARHYEAAIRLEPENSPDYNGLAGCFLNLGRAAAAVAPMLKAAELEPTNTIYADHLNTVLFASGQETDVISNFLGAVRANPASFRRYLDALSSDTNRVDLMNNLAWAFATNPDSKLRNGQFAVRLARRACEITGYQITVCVGTLAAAYAENSQSDEAVSTAQLACSLATAGNNKDLLKKNQELLDLFRTHEPYHEITSESSGQK